MRIFGLIGERLGHSLSRSCSRSASTGRACTTTTRLFELEHVGQLTDLLSDYRTSQGSASPSPTSAP